MVKGIKLVAGVEMVVLDDIFVAGAEVATVELDATSIEGATVTSVLGIDA